MSLDISLDNYPLTILHISDLHFGATDVIKYGAIRALIDKVRPDLLFITGDIVNYPRRKYFLEAAKFVEFCRDKCQQVFVIPGNHDAMFGGVSLRGFRKYLGASEFAEFVNVKGAGIGVAIFGFNSTCSPFPNPFMVHSGKIDSSQLQWFKTQKQELIRQAGAFSYESALKFVLIHHHPLPTLLSQAERLVYLKNSGELLNTLAKEQIDIIFHGHQHDPCDFSINYNQGGDEDLFMILSAGTAMKSDKLSGLEALFSTILSLSAPTNGPQVEIVTAELGQNSSVSNTPPAELGDRISRDTALFLVQIYKEFIDVEQHAFSLTRKSFVPYKGFRKANRKTALSTHSVHYDYTVKNTADLVEQCSVILRCKNGFTLPYFDINLGVDEATPGLSVKSIAGLQFNVQRINGNGTFNITTQASLVKNEDKWKLIRVELDPPIKEISETIVWSHVWPHGWYRLLNSGTDIGSYHARWYTEEFSVDICFEPPLIGKIEDVSYNNPQLDATKQRFSVRSIPKNSILTYSISLDRK